MRIGVAVSGGGHRATAWALGCIAALVETGSNVDVVSVASVSGGSIANGAVAAAGDLRAHTGGGTFAAAIGPTLRVVATDGLFFPGRSTRRYVAATLGFVGLTIVGGVAVAAALVAAGRDHALLPYAVLGAVAGLAIGWALGGMIGRPRLLTAAVAGALGAAAGWGGAALATGIHGSGLWVGLAVLVVAWIAMWRVAVVLLSRRGRAVERALGAGLFADPVTGRALRLADVDSQVNHVMCATDLESGDQFYMAPRFLYGYREGITTDGPQRVTLAAAVQASAALPGAFPPAVVTTGPFVRNPSVEVPEHAPERVVLVDGGVYDNMADQWEGGLAERQRGCAPLRDVQEPAQVLVVANASEAWEWRPFTATGHVGLELSGLQRDQGIQYDVSTARRRNQLLERFRAARRRGEGGGVIVMIDRVPLSLAEPFAEGSDDVAERAREAVARLRHWHTDAEWEAMAARNAGVATTLGPIGVDPTLDLMEHAYTSTVVGLYVLHGVGALKEFPRATYASTMEA